MYNADGVSICCRGRQWHIIPLAKLAMALLANIFFNNKKIGKLGLAPLCVSTSGQQTFGPLFELLNMPLVVGDFFVNFL